MRRLRGNMLQAAEQGPKDFADLLLVPGRRRAKRCAPWRSLPKWFMARPCRFTPIRRGFRSPTGGPKDVNPRFPIPTWYMDRTIGVLKSGRAERQA